MKKILMTIAFTMVLAMGLRAQNASLSMPGFHMNGIEHYDQWSLYNEHHFVVPVFMDTFVTGVDSFSFNVVYDPAFMIPRLVDITTINDPAYLLWQNYLGGILFSMVNGESILADTFAVPDGRQMMTVRFKASAEFTAGIHGNCQGLMIYLPFYKQSPCLQDSVLIEFWDGLYMGNYINPDHPLTAVMTGSQTYSSDSSNLDLTNGYIVQDEFAVTASQFGLNIEATLTNGQGPFDFLWNTGDTTQFISPQQSGTYIITVTDFYGCVAVDSASFIYTGVPDALSFNADLWPNPCIDRLYFRLSGSSRPSGKVEMFSIEGKKVMDSFFNGREFKLDISSLETGLYFARITSGNMSATKKIVISE